MCTITRFEFVKDIQSNSSIAVHIQPKPLLAPCPPPKGRRFGVACRVLGIFVLVFVSLLSLPLVNGMKESKVLSGGQEMASEIFASGPEQSSTRVSLDDSSRSDMQLQFDRGPVIESGTVGWESSIDRVDPKFRREDGPTESETFQILRSFYFSLNGDVWTRSDGWLQPTVPICEWWGVTCLPRNTSKEFRPVVKLELPQNSLKGMIPNQISQLSSLVVIDLSNNALMGPIPSDIGLLSHLNNLILSDNMLTGTVPKSMGDLFTLKILDLSHNQLSSPLPLSFWDMARLQYMNLSYNQFKEKLSPGLSQLTSLLGLTLSHNQFYGPLPNGLNALTSLNTLDISHNHFSGDIAPELTQPLQSLQVFIGSHNNFSGGTCGLGYLTNIRKLLLDHNALDGELHPYLYDLSQCVALDLRANKLSGYVPETLLGSLLARTQLIYLNLLSNPELISWEQRIPPFLGVDPHALVHARIGSFVCHRLFLRDSPSTTIMVDPSFFSYKHCNCIRDSYGVPPDQCYDCPPGATCSGDSTFTFDAGWYPIIEPRNASNNNVFRRKLVQPDEEAGQWQHHEIHSNRPYRPGPDYDDPKDLPKPFELPNDPHKDPHKTTEYLHTLASTTNFVLKPTAPLGFLSGPVVLYPCPDLSSSSSACNPNAKSVFFYNSSTSFGIVRNETLCAKGYDRRLCTFCTCEAASNPSCTRGGPQSGDCTCYYRAGLKCVACSNVWKFSHIMALVCVLWILFILFMAFFFYCRKVPVEASPMRVEWIARIVRKFPTEMRHSGFLKILLVYLQTLSIVSKDQILTYFKITTGDIFSLGAICSLPVLSDPFYQHLVYLLLPLALLVGLGTAILLAAAVSSIAIRLTRDEAVQDEDFVNDHLIYGGGAGSDYDSKPMDSRPKKEDTYSFICQGFSVVLTVFWWFLFGVAYRALSVFNCASDPISSFLDSQPWLGCDSPQWRGLKILSIIAIVIYLALVPLVFAILLFAFRKRINEPCIKTVMEILCASYRSGVFWYELVATARRIGLAAVLALVPGSSAFKMSTVCLVLVVGLYLQILFRPFVTKFENVMEELAMVTIILTYAAQIGFNIRLAQNGTLNIVTIVLNFLLIACILYTYISRTYFSKYRYLPWSAKPNQDDQASSLANISSVNESASAAGSLRR